jgi:hypothetical protein
VSPAASLIAAYIALLAAQGIGTSGNLGARVDRVVQRVDARWVLVATAGDESDRIHRWRRVNEIMTVQARQFDSDSDACQHVKEIVTALGVPVEEKLKAGSYAARIEWGDGRSTVYLAAGSTAVVISAPSAELARRLTRQAAVEFSDRVLSASGRR